MAINTILRVTPEELRRKSGEISTDIEAIAGDVNRLHEELVGTKGYWKGDAGEQYRSRFEDYYSQMNELLTRMRTYPTRILQMAGIYEEAEDSNVQTASQLTPDIMLR